MDEYSTLVNTLTQTAALNNAWSADQALNQMAFQKMLSDTAHRREVADLKAAGLNPILSAKLGGASTPSGAMGTTDTSLVSSLAQIFDKMLDVADNSAKAVASVSGSGYGYYSGSQFLQDGSETGKTLLENIQDDFAPGSQGFTGKDMPKALGKIVNLDAAAAFVNGLLHLDNTGNKNTARSYQTGKVITDALYDKYEQKMENINTAAQLGKSAVDKIVGGIKTVVNNVLPSSAKTTATTSKVSAKPTSSVASAAKSVGSKIVSGIKSIFKK